MTHFWDNYTQKVKHDPKMAGCFYRGTVKGDRDSDISVSLCGGMVSYESINDHFLVPTYISMLSRKTRLISDFSPLPTLLRLFFFTTSRKQIISFIFKVRDLQKWMRNVSNWHVAVFFKPIACFNNSEMAS